MKLSSYEKLWLVAAFAFIAYPIGDLLDFWDIDAAIVLAASVVLLIAGREVGKRGKISDG